MFRGRSGVALLAMSESDAANAACAQELVSKLEALLGRSTDMPARTVELEAASAKGNILIDNLPVDDVSREALIDALEPVQAMLSSRRRSAALARRALSKIKVEDRWWEQPPSPEIQHQGIVVFEDSQLLTSTEERRLALDRRRAARMHVCQQQGKANDNAENENADLERDTMSAWTEPQKVNDVIISQNTDKEAQIRNTLAMLDAQLKDPDMSSFRLPEVSEGNHKDYEFGSLHWFLSPFACFCCAERRQSGIR
uniref:Uncharacterized protein n=1 Tax=Noctiluca scintillans TaxID=2966 RepID=A0A6T9F2I5_NOCSC